MVRGAQDYQTVQTAQAKVLWGGSLAHQEGKEQRASRRVKGEVRAKPCRALGFILRVLVSIPREKESQ